MVADFVHRLSWNWESSVGYRYGATIKRFPDDSLHFAHPLLASGTVLVEWSSQANSKNGQQAALPLLNREDTHYISANFTTLPEKTAYLKIEYFDAFHQMLGHVVIQSQESKALVLPPKTDYYCFKIISSGCTDLYFDNLLISPLELPTYEVDRFWLQESPVSSVEKQDSLVVLLTEPERHGFYWQHASFLSEKVDVLTVSSAYKTGQLYLNQQLQESILSFIAQKQEKNLFQKVIFMGYGPISNMAALFYKQLIPTSLALVSEHAHPLEYYQTLLEKDRPKTAYPNFTQLYHTKFDEQSVLVYKSPVVELSLSHFTSLHEHIHTLTHYNFQSFLDWQEELSQHDHITTPQLASLSKDPAADQ